MRAAGFLVLAAAFALASWLGWWTVPAVGFLWGVLRPAVSRPVGWAAMAALLGWGFWLVVDLAGDPSGLGRLGGRLGLIFGVPQGVLLAATLLLAVLLSGSAAVVGHEIAGWLRRQPERPTT